jgi:ribose transport system permease protein
MYATGGKSVAAPGPVQRVGHNAGGLCPGHGVYGVQLITSVQWLNDMLNGVALIVAVSFAVWRQRRAAADATPVQPAESSLAGKEARADAP